MPAKRLGIPLSVAAALALAYASASGAQSATPVSTPPVPLNGPGAPVASDSTLNCGPSPCGASGVGNSTVMIGAPSSPPVTPPVVQCVSGSLGTRTQTVNKCPAGTMAFNSTSQFVKQTSTGVRTCPAGAYGAPQDNWSAWTPSPTIGDGCGVPSGTGIQVGANNTAANWGSSDGSVSVFPENGGGNPAPLYAHFGGTWTWNGQTKFVDVHCSGNESCQSQSVYNIGGVNWTFGIDGTAMMRGDCVMPGPNGGQPRCRLGARGTIRAQ